LALAVVLFGCVWVPARNALAQDALNRGTDVAMSAQSPTAGPVAVRLYRQAIEYDPAWAEAWEKYGFVVGIVQDREEGVRAIERAMVLAPTSFRPAQSLGRLYEETGKLEKAVEPYKKALALFPNQTRTLLRLGEAYQRLGETKSAFLVYRRMLEIEESPYNKYRALEDVDVDTSYAFAHYQLGRAAVSAGSSEGLRVGLSEFEHALGIVREYFEKGEETDKMFLMLRRPREYRAEDMRMLEAKVRWRMAAVYDRLGDGERASEERERAQSVWPDVEKATTVEDGGSQE
jgi:tetratricopeptide (TPR) repeat protein